MADTAQIRQANKASLREILRGGGEYSKNDLVRLTGLSFPTVSHIIDEMAASGEVREEGTTSSTGGRRAKIYAFEPSYQLLMGLRLEGRIIRWFLCGLDGTQRDGGEAEYRSSVLSMLEALLTRIKAQYPNLAAAALSVDEPLLDGRTVGLSGRPELRETDLRRFLSDRLGLPADAERDVYLAAEGSRRGKNAAETTVCIHLGKNGMAAGAVAEGKLLHGASGLAGELHTLPIKNNRDYAHTHFAGADILAYYVQMIRAYVAILNPGRIVLYDDPLLEGKTEQIRKACAQTLSPQAMPEIELSESFVKDCETGLFLRALKQSEMVR